MAIDLGSALGKIIIDAQDAIDQTGKVGSALGGLAGPAGLMAGAVAAAGVAAGGAIVALGVSSVGVAREFESAMAVMSTAVDPVTVGAQTTAEAMAILGDASLAVGSDTALIGVSASTAAEAMTGLYKAGLSTGEIFGDLQGYMAGTAELSGALRASIDLAAASELDMVAASELAAVTLATFGGHLETEAERAEFINSAMNNFVQTADASQASVTDLAAALGNIGPTAAAFGFGLEDVNVALGILSDRGITGSEAGTALKSMMTNMMRDTPAVTGALKELGISLYDLDGNMRPLPDIISQFDSALNGTREVMVTVGGRTEEQNRQLELAMNAYDQATEAIYKHEAGLKVLSDDGLAKVQSQQAAANGEIERLQSIVGDTTVSLQDMTQEQRNQYIQTIAGTYGMNALNSLLAEGTIGWEEMEAAVGNAATMQETAAARTATLDGAMEALGGVAETFRIKVGTALIPVLTSLAGIGATLIERYGPTLTTLFENVGNGIQRIIDVIQNGQLGELFTVFEDGSSVLGGIFESFGMGEQQANNLATGISNVMTQVQNFIAPVAEFVQNHGPLLLQILGGVALAFGAFTIITTVVGWISGLIAAISGIGAAIATAGGGITGLIAILGGPLTIAIAAIAAAVGAFAVAWANDWGGIREKVQPVIDAVRGAIQTAADTIRSFIGNLQEGMSPLNAFIEAIWNVAPQGLIDALVNFRDSVLPGLMASIQTFLTSVGTWWNATWPQLQSAFQTVWGIVQGVIQSAIAVIGPAIQTFLASLAPVWETLKTLWPPIVEMWEAAKPVLLAVATVIGAALATIGAALVAAVGLITGVISGLARAIGPIVNGIIGAVKGIVQALTGVFQTLQGVFRLLVGLFTGNADLIEAGWEKLKEGVTNIIMGLVTGALRLFAGLVEGIAGFVEGLVDGVVSFFKNLFDQLVGHSIITDLVERIEELWESLWNKVEQIVQTGVDLVVDIIDAFRSLFEGDWETFRDRIGEIWEEAWDKVMEIAEGLWDRVLTWLTGLWDNVKGWFEEKDWGAMGKSLVDGIIAGVTDTAGALWNAVTNMINEALNRIRQAINPGSPSRTTFPWGVSLADGLIAGVRSRFAAAAEVMDGLFAAMSNVATLGGGFGGQFQRRVIDPLRGSLDASQAGLDSISAAIDQMVEQLGYEAGFANTPGAIMELMRRINYRYATQQERDTARTLLAFLRERNQLNIDHLRLQRELEDQEARLLRLQQAQQQNDFLQEQLKLLQLIRENNLSTSILDGLTLGLEADAGALMDAMRRALEQMIRAAENELGIGSPSKVFRRIAAQAKQGLIVEMADSRAVVRAARGMVRNMAESAEMALAGIGGGAAGSAVDSSRRMTLYGGQHFYFQQRRGSVLEEVQGLLAP